MQNLIAKHQRLIKNLPQIYIREVYKKLESEHRIVGVVGPRGIGKTTYVLNYIRDTFNDSNQALYVAADDPHFAFQGLYDLATDFIENYDGRLLVIDEIHRYPNWSQHLKNIYDMYHDQLKILFTGSSTIDIIKEKYDLSRRAIVKNLPGLSFREYLEIHEKKQYPIYSLKKIIQNRMRDPDNIAQIPKLRGLFKKYLQRGYYPATFLFQDENDFFSSLHATIDKIIHTDIATSFSIESTNLQFLKKILAFIYTSSPSKININRIAQSLKISHHTVTSYIEMMRASGLLRFLLVDTYGHAFLRNTEKVFLDNPNLYYALQEMTGKHFDVGQLRELFVINQLSDAGYKVFYSKKSDLTCGQYTFEIGGKNKDDSQIKDVENAFVIQDDVLYGGKYSIPLWMIGFLY